MYKESSDPEVYEDCIRAVDTPIKAVTGSDKFLIDTKWTNINRRYYIATDITVPTPQHQNYCEQVGGSFKFAVLILFHNTLHVSISY